MRVLKFACILAALLFSATVMADVIGPHGEHPAHHYFPGSNKYLIKRDFLIHLSIDKTPPGSTLMLIDENGWIHGETRCAGNIPCRMTIKEAGDLYLAPGGAPQGPVINVKGLLRAHKLDFLRAFKTSTDLLSKSLSCRLEKKGPSYIMKCRR